MPGACENSQMPSPPRSRRHLVRPVGRTPLAVMSSVTAEALAERACTLVVVIRRLPVIFIVRSSQLTHLPGYPEWPCDRLHLIPDRESGNADRASSGP
jgi:hypothetical protein